MSKPMIDDYPWTKFPLVIGAPMRLISTPPLAIAISRAGGLGFLGAGTDPDAFAPLLNEAGKQISELKWPVRGEEPLQTLPVGIGIINWGHSSSEAVVKALTESPYPPPAAIWFFAPRETSELASFSTAVRKATRHLSRLWIQVGSVQQVVECCKYVVPDVFVVQGQDAGGHGLASSCGITSLVPETLDTLQRLYGPEGDLRSNSIPRVVAAGGIAEGRSAAAALALGAEGVVMGTRYLSSPEANIMNGYRQEIIRANDGGQNTVRSRVYDTLRGTHGWPSNYGARGVINASYEDAVKGMDEKQNIELYQEALEMGNAGWGPKGRMTTYAGSCVGMVHEVKPAGEITREVQEGCKRVITNLTMKNVV